MSCCQDRAANVSSPQELTQNIKTSTNLHTQQWSHQFSCKLSLHGQVYCHSHQGFCKNVLTRRLAFPISSRIPWSQIKTYFMFKLEKVMDDFHASTPEQRGPHNPNVDYVPFEEMKTRILKIVDGYNGWAKLIISHFANCNVSVTQVCTYFNWQYNYVRYKKIFQLWLLILLLRGAFKCLVDLRLNWNTFSVNVNT